MNWDFWFSEPEIIEEGITKVISDGKDGYTKGTILYYNQNNQYHRIDGPAVEYPDGTKCWYKEGKLHRIDGPAVEYPDGSKEWYIEGKLHRTDGPAKEYTDGTKYWYKEGKQLTEKEFNSSNNEKVDIILKKGMLVKNKSNTDIYIIIFYLPKKKCARFGSFR